MNPTTSNKFPDIDNEVMADIRRRLRYDLQASSKIVVNGVEKSVQQDHDQRTFFWIANSLSEQQLAHAAFLAGYAAGALDASDRVMATAGELLKPLTQDSK